MQKAIHQGGSTGQIQKSQNKIMLLKSGQGPYLRQTLSLRLPDAGT